LSNKIREVNVSSNLVVGLVSGLFNRVIHMVLRLAW
jgi:hypothetical protein